MPVHTGTANDHKDMLDIVRQKLQETAFMGSGSEWTELRWDTSDEYELAIQGPGFGLPNGSPIAHIKTHTGTNPNYGNWLLEGVSTWDPGKAFRNQPGSLFLFNGGQRSHCQSKDPFDFWLYANGHRFIVVADLTSNDSMCYMGLISPPGVPADYPYPMAIAGNSNVDDQDPYDVTADGPSNFFNGYRAMQFKFPDGSWRPVYNISSNGFPLAQNHNATIDYLINGSGDTGGALMWPWNCFENQYNDGDQYFVSCLDGSHIVLPATLMNRNSSIGPRGTFGHPTGVYFTPNSDGISPHDTITTGDGKIFRVFKNYWRSSYRDYCAIREV